MWWYSHGKLDKDYNLKHGINPSSQTWLRLLNGAPQNSMLTAQYCRRDTETDVRGREEMSVGSDIGYTSPLSLSKYGNSEMQL